MALKMVRETYIGNLPFIEGFKVLVDRSRKVDTNLFDLHALELAPSLETVKEYLDSGDRKELVRKAFIEINTKKAGIILKMLAKKSLTIPVYLVSDGTYYNTRHMVAEMLGCIRRDMLRETQNAARKLR